MAIFKPVKRTPRYTELQALAAEAGLSLKEYLRQAIDFAVENRARE